MCMNKKMSYFIILNIIKYLISFISDKNMIQYT